MRPARLLLGLGLLVLGASPIESAQGSVTLRVTVDRPEVVIGEPIRYVMTLERPEGVEVAWPVVGNTLGDFTVEEFGSGLSRKTDGFVIQDRWLRLSLYATGSHTIPAPVVTYRDAGGEEREVRGRAVTITVMSLLPQDFESQDVRDAKPLKPLRQGAWWWGLLALALLAGGVGLWWWRRHRLAPEPIVPPPQPHEIALGALERLRQEGLPSRRQFEVYYVRLSDIVRAYIEARFTLRAPEMTTEEFLKALSHGQALSPGHRSLLQDFLVRCDLVKFARYQPTEPEAAEAFHAARRFIEETVPSEEPVETTTQGVSQVVG